MKAAAAVPATNPRTDTLRASEGVGAPRTGAPAAATLIGSPRPPPASARSFPDHALPDGRLGRPFLPGFLSSQRSSSPPSPHALRGGPQSPEAASRARTRYQFAAEG